MSLHDTKSVPIQEIVYPGVEVHTTFINNMLDNNPVTIIDDHDLGNDTIEALEFDELKSSTKASVALENLPPHSFVIG